MQGRVFVTAALTVTVAVLLFGRPGANAELWMAAGLILLLGVPHGALDVSYARALLGVRSVAGWAGFTLLYLLIAAAVGWFWHASPLLFLATFLLVSAAHFSGDLAAGTPWFTRLLYGGAVIVLPCLRYEGEVGALFAALIGTTPGLQLAEVLRLLALPWLLALVLAIAHATRCDRAMAAELAAVTLLATFAPPLLAFTIYFCAMHSLRHMLRTSEHHHLSARALVLTALVPMAGVLLLLGLLWPRMAALTGSGVLEVQLITLLFIGLAALTVPHMLLVERVRWRAVPGSAAS